MKIISWIILVGFGWQAFAHEPADGSIYATAGPFALKAHPRNHDFTAPVLGGFGLLAEGDLDHNGGIEISAFYLHQLFSLQQNGKVIEEVGKRIYIVSGYRLWPTKNFSGGLGFFSSYSIGSGEVVRNDYGSVPPPETSAHVITAYGFDFSLQWEPWRKERYSAIVDARYSYSVTARPGEDSNFYGVLVALKYYVQNPEMAPPGR
ncbi:MAG: hypothetical protein ACXVA9_13815 [Bdellovibrionales bacterium]